MLEKVTDFLKFVKSILGAVEYDVVHHSRKVVPEVFVGVSLAPLGFELVL